MGKPVAIFGDVDVAALHQFVVFGRLNFKLLSVLKLRDLFLDHLKLLSLVFHVNSIVSQLQDLQEVELLGLQN